MTGVGSSPALATCETSQVLLAGVSGGFPGVLPFRPTYRLARLEMSEIILKGTLNRVKKKKKKTFFNIKLRELFVLYFILNGKLTACATHISQGYTLLSAVFILTITQDVTINTTTAVIIRVYIALGYSGQLFSFM